MNNIALDFKVYNKKDEIISNMTKIEWADNSFFINGYNENDVIIMRFTGYSDLYNKKIYEGDILECAYYGQGDRWIDGFIVRFGEYVEWGEDDIGNIGFYLQGEGDDDMYGLCHPKFQRERIVKGNIYHNEDVLKNYGLIKK